MAIFVNENYMYYNNTNVFTEGVIDNILDKIKDAPKNIKENVEKLVSAIKKEDVKTIAKIALILVLDLTVTHNASTLNWFAASSSVVMAAVKGAIVGFGIMIIAECGVEAIDKIASAIMKVKTTNKDNKKMVTQCDSTLAAIDKVKSKANKK